MCLKQITALLLIATLAMCPADSWARKKNKKYQKKEVKIEQTITADHTPRPISITDAPKQLYGEWDIESIRKKPVLTRERAYIYLDFAAHKVYGNNGCNKMNGEFRQMGNDISFKDMITTNESCHSGTSERTVMKVLSEVQHYQLSIDGEIELLTLTNAKGQQLMTLRRQNLDFLNGVWLVKEAGGEDVMAKNVRIVVDAAMRTIHGNTGCNIINGIITIDPSKDFAIQFEDLHSSGNRCEDIGIETAVLVALEQTERCKRLEGGVMALTDGKGNNTLVLSPIKVR